MSDTIGLLDQAISLDRNSGEPLFNQIASSITQRIQAGDLPPGMRLASVRMLADELGVNRATVQRAYQKLEEAGLVASRVGSGTEVLPGSQSEMGATNAGAAPTPTGAPPPGAPAFARGVLELQRAVSAPQAGPATGAIDFAMLLPDVALFPRDRLAAGVARALERGDEVLQYGAPAGLASLRSAVATRLGNQGLDVGPEDVLIVNGIQQALDLLAKTYIDRGDSVVVEAPTYANVLPLLKLYGGRAQSVPLDADGIAIDPLRRSLATHRPKLLYTMPSFQNPTGVTMPLERRQALIAACKAEGCLIVEDGCEQELHFDQTPIPPLAALDSNVIHLGTFSKGLFPGLRLGYVVARPEIRHMLELTKRFSDYHADLLSQAVLSELLDDGDYDTHLDRLRRTYKTRMKATTRALQAHLPSEVRFTPPTGGYKLWLELPTGVSARTVTDRARRRGILLLDGAPFFETPANGDRYLRLSISRTNPKRIDEGIAILGEVLSEAIRGRATTSTKDRREAPPLV